MANLYPIPTVIAATLTPNPVLQTQAFLVQLTIVDRMTQLAADEKYIGNIIIGDDN